MLEFNGHGMLTVKKRCVLFPYFVFFIRQPLFYFIRSFLLGGHARIQSSTSFQIMRLVLSSEGVIKSARSSSLIERLQATLLDLSKQKQLWGQALDVFQLSNAESAGKDAPSLAPEPLQTKNLFIWTSSWLERRIPRLILQFTHWCQDVLISSSIETNSLGSMYNGICRCPTSGHRRADEGFAEALSGARLMSAQHSQNTMRGGLVQTYTYPLGIHRCTFLKKAACNLGWDLSTDNQSRT